MASVCTFRVDLTHAIPLRQSAFLQTQLHSRPLIFPCILRIAASIHPCAGGSLDTGQPGSATVLPISAELLLAAEGPFRFTGFQTTQGPPRGGGHRQWEEGSQRCLGPARTLPVCDLVTSKCSGLGNGSGLIYRGTIILSNHRSSGFPTNLCLGAAFLWLL